MAAAFAELLVTAPVVDSDRVRIVHLDGCEHGAARAEAKCADSPRVLVEGDARKLGVPVRAADPAVPYADVGAEVVARDLPRGKDRPGGVDYALVLDFPKADCHTLDVVVVSEKKPLLVERRGAV